MLRDLKMIGVASNLAEAHRQRDITEIISIEIIRLSSTSSTPSSQIVIFYYISDFGTLVIFQARNVSVVHGKAVPIILVLHGTE